MSWVSTECASLPVLAGGSWSCWPPREGWSPWIERVPWRARPPRPHCEYRLLAPCSWRIPSCSSCPPPQADLVFLPPGISRAERQRRSPRPSRPSREYPCPCRQHHFQAWQGQARVSHSSRLYPDFPDSPACSFLLQDRRGTAQSFCGVSCGRT